MTKKRGKMVLLGEGKLSSWFGAYYCSWLPLNERGKNWQSDSFPGKRVKLWAEILPEKGEK